jgi:DNA-binding protein YbaB
MARLRPFGLLALGLLAASWPAQADTWNGGFLSKSGILWTYNVQVNGKLVKVTIQGDRDGKKIEAACADGSLDASSTFEVHCRYPGNNLHFKVRAELNSDSTYASYLADNGDRTSVQLMRNASAPASEPPKPTVGAQDSHPLAPPQRMASAPPSQPRSAATSALSLRLPSCNQMNFLMNYTRHSFVDTDDPILGLPPSQWTADTLHGVEQWATKCLSQTPRSSGGNWGTWEMFRREAAIGMDMRKEMDRKNEANRTATAALDERWNRAVPLSAGGYVSCRALGTTDFNQITLNDTFFAQQLRAYTAEDFRTIFATLSECDNADWNVDRNRYHYYPDRSELKKLPQQWEYLLNAEMRAKSEAEKRAQAAREEAQERQRTEGILIEKAKKIAIELEQSPRSFGGNWPNVPSTNTGKLEDPPQCNDPRVLAYFFNELYRKHVETALHAFRENLSDTTVAQAVLTLSAWKIDVENIRQIAFDPANHIRQCGATFQSNDSTLDWAGNPFASLVLIRAQCGSGKPQLSYRLELLLDKPSDFYVSFVCQ